MLIVPHIADICHKKLPLTLPIRQAPEGGIVRGSIGATINIFAFKFDSTFVKIMIFYTVIVRKMLNKELIEVLIRYQNQLII